MSVLIEISKIDKTTIITKAPNAEVGAFSRMEVSLRSNMQLVNLSPAQRQFVIDRLESGSSLSRELASGHIDRFDTVYTDASFSIAESDNFSHGKLSLSKGSELTVQKYIQLFLSKDLMNVCILEEQLGAISDQCMRPYSSRLTVYENEIYHWFRYDDLTKPEDVSEFFSRSGWFASLVGFLVSNSLFSARLTKDKIQKLAKNTEVIMVGIFDSENILYLQKS
jgi:hypothetical protein